MKNITSPDLIIIESLNALKKENSFHNDVFAVKKKSKHKGATWFFKNRVEPTITELTDLYFDQVLEIRIYF